MNFSYLFLMVCENENEIKLIYFYSLNSFNFTTFFSSIKNVNIYIICTTTIFEVNFEVKLQVCNLMHNFLPAICCIYRLKCLFKIMKG